MSQVTSPQAPQVTSDFSHLPAWAAKAIEGYEADCASGAITFTTGEFADDDRNQGSDWLAGNLAAHLPAMDFSR